MAESPEFKAAEATSVTSPTTVFIVGYTGETGKALVKYLDKMKTFAKVKLIGRREVKLELENADLFEQVVVDFDKLDDHSDAFKGATAGFCALGTTRAKSGYEGFVRVDHDYVVKVGEIAKAAGCQKFSLVSSAGANKDSMLLYSRTKGQVEEALKAILFDHLAVFRPMAIIADRPNARIGESIVFFMLKPVKFLFPTAFTVPVEYLAKAMVVNTLATSDQAFQLFDNKAIHKLGGEAKK